MIPPSDGPIEARAITRPRFTTNHLDSVALTTNGPTMNRPTWLNAPRTTMNCQSVSICETPISASPPRVPPKSMMGRAP